MFQTPAPRGGVPLLILWLLFAGVIGWVSNPCASGRCSSDARLQDRSRIPGRFKPLRLGAVFLCASLGLETTPPWGFKPLRLGAVFLWERPPPLVPTRLRVSNPCASGRCSSGICSNEQSSYHLSSFKPLRLGAVFLWPGAVSGSFDTAAFQTPAPRGGVPLISGNVGVAVAGNVSNPCASGRCSSEESPTAQADA